MSSSLRWLAAALLLLLCSAEVLADACFIPFVRRDRPMPASLPTPEHDLVIVRDPNVTQAELRIPKAMTVADASTPVSTRHAMAGLALSAAFVGGGLWCMGYRAGEIPKKKVLAAVGAGVLLLCVLTAVNFADATPAYRPPGMNHLVHQMVRLGEIEVNVVVVPEGDAIQLIVPPEIADKISGSYSNPRMP